MTFASPWAPAGSSAVQAPPPAHWLRVLPPTVICVCPLVQNERSPCLAASIAATVKPCPLKVSATANMAARPLPSPWRKTTSGEHFKGANPASAPEHVGAFVFVAAGRAIKTLIVSSVVAPVGWNAPVAGSRRLNVVMVVSITSAMLPLGTTAPLTPYLGNAVVALLPVTVP